jgi:hypothetical protein
MARSARFVKVAAVATAVVFAASLVGCSNNKSPAAVTSAWPIADAERTVPKPATPPRWPLTGLDAPSAAAIQTRVLSVKIENSAASRPQTALNRADLVYESLAEGGITRFNCLYQSQEPKTIGPVRSARLSDGWIVPQYNALFFFAGASTFVTNSLRKLGIPLLSQEQGINRPYVRSGSRPAPHNLFLKPDVAREEAKRLGYPTTQTLKPFAFVQRAMSATVTVTRIDIPFSPAQRTTWTYDPAKKIYLRENNGARHIDAETGQQVRARNVVVMWAPMRSTGHPDKFGSTTYDITLGGTNRASVFHDGQRWDGTWTADRKSPPVFRADDGTLIRLARGTSWFEVIPTNVNISLK